MRLATTSRLRRHRLSRSRRAISARRRRCAMRWKPAACSGQSSSRRQRRRSAASCASRSIARWAAPSSTVSSTYAPISARRWAWRSGGRHAAKSHPLRRPSSRLPQAAVACSRAGAIIGSSIVKVVPTFILDRHEIVPPQPSTIIRQNDNPRPVPTPGRCADTNGMNT